MLEIIFQYGPFSLRTFNIFLAIGFLFATLFLLRYIKRKKLNLSFLSYRFPYLLFAALIGGRIGIIFENIEFYAQNPLSSLFIWDMEFSIFGALYASLLALYILTRKSREDFWLWLDAFTLSGIVWLFFLNIGHFFNGTDYGIPTDLPWGIAFDALNIPFLNPIHPTQLYSAGVCFLIFALLSHYNRRTHLSGMVGTFGIMLYSLSALGIDFLHGTPSFYAKISLGAIAVFAFIAFIHCSHKKLDLHGLDKS
jgi:phosphatidylglycerol:prolipoprotein diacylglycerol transferase